MTSASLDRGPLKIGERGARRIVRAWPVTRVEGFEHGGPRARLSPCRRWAINQDPLRRELYVQRRRPGGPWTVIDSPRGAGLASLVLLFRLDPHAFGVDEPPATTIRRWWAALARREAVLARFWPADHLDPPRALPRPGEVVIDGATAWARIAADDPDDLAAAVDATGEWIAASSPDVRRVVYQHGEVRTVDVCPTPLARAARLAARGAAQTLGEAAAVEPIDGADWRQLDGRWLLESAEMSLGDALARQLLDGAGAVRARLGKLRLRGPDPAPALPAPALPEGFAEAWATADRFAVSRDNTIKLRSSAPGGRPRKLSLAQYLRGRRAVEAAGSRPSDVAVTAALARLGMEVSRSIVRTRRQLFETLDAGALAELDAELCAEGLAAAAAAPTPAIAADDRLALFPWVGSKAPMLGSVIGVIDQAAGPGPLHYAEPCAGGLSVGLHLAAEGRLASWLIADADPAIAGFWRWVRDDPGGVFETAARFDRTGAAYSYEPAQYFVLRTVFNDLTGVEQAGAWLYLMWRGYNGLWRRNGSGGLNNSAGRRKPPYLKVSAEQVHRVSTLLQGAEIVCADVEDTLDELARRDEPRRAVYIDPPYWPTSKTAGFAGYTGQGFQAGHHAGYVAAARRYVEAGGWAVISGPSSAPMLHLLEGFDITWVDVRRRVSGKVETRGDAPEIIASQSPLRGVAHRRTDRSNAGLTAHDTRL